jgi:hypothetical protein
MKEPIDLSQLMQENIVFSIDTPWETDDVYKTLSKNDFDFLLDKLREEFDNKLAYKLGDSLTFQVMRDMDADL